MATGSRHSLRDSENQFLQPGYSFILQTHLSSSEPSEVSHPQHDISFTDALSTKSTYSLVEKDIDLNERSLNVEETASTLVCSFDTTNKTVYGSLPSPNQEAQKSSPSEQHQRRSPRVLQRPPHPLGENSKKDRFITDHNSFDPFSSPIRYNKSPDQLSPTEKLFRQRDRHVNPFSPRKVRSMNRQIQRDYTARRVRSPQTDFHLVSQALSRSTIFNQSNVFGPSDVGESPNTARNYASAAPSYVAKFLEDTLLVDDDGGMYEARVSFALDIDLAKRVLMCQASPNRAGARTSSPCGEHLHMAWEDNAWKQVGGLDRFKTRPKPKARIAPSMPFRILDAPLLRDDYYCQPMALCHTTGLLAVGLGEDVYLWSERRGIGFCPFPRPYTTSAVTSLSFSSTEGQQSILAVGRFAGQVYLWSTFEPEIRFSVRHPAPVSCVSFKPTLSRRKSLRFCEKEVNIEELVVGDTDGGIWYYSVEWPSEADGISRQWEGAMILIAKIAAHAQQICGMTWSPDELFLATGADDNSCLLFDLRDLTTTVHRKDVSREKGRLCKPNVSFSFRNRSQPNSIIPPNETLNSNMPLVHNELGLVLSGVPYTIVVAQNRQKFRLHHSAAVKAMAFAPWQHSLLATGGGMKDGKIHFYHAPTGTLLATINVGAQVTSLIWSRTKREIAATFGYAQPDHPVRIAVFAWPSCHQVFAVPWAHHISTVTNPRQDDQRPDPGRAIWAIFYPAGPNTWPNTENPENMSEREYWSLGRRSLSSSSEASGRTEASEPAIINNMEEVEYYPMIPGQEKEARAWSPCTIEEGSIIVAASDETIRFYEIWSGSTNKVLKSSGLLGGSEILEELEGLERPGKEIIR